MSLALCEEFLRFLFPQGKGVVSDQVDQLLDTLATCGCQLIKPYVLGDEEGISTKSFNCLLNYERQVFRL